VKVKFTNASRVLFIGVIGIHREEEAAGIQSSSCLIQGNAVMWSGCMYSRVLISKYSSPSPDFSQVLVLVLASV